MYELIVVPVDGSELSHRALVPAAVLAGREGVPLEVVRIVSSRGASARELDELERVAGSHSGVRMETRLEFNEDPSAYLGRLARTEPATLLCLSTHGRGGLGQAVLGSVATEVVRQAERPVLLVGPAYQPDRGFDLASMVVGVDGSPISEAVIPTAISWAEAYGMRLHLVQVVGPIAEARTAADRIPQDFTAPDSYLARLANRVGERVPTDWRVLADERPERALTDLAEAEDSSLIAVGTHGESGLRRVALGSVAASVTRAAPCPVVVVRSATQGR